MWFVNSGSGGDLREAHGSRDVPISADEVECLKGSERKRSGRSQGFGCSPAHRVSTGLKVVPGTGATFACHHGLIDVQLFFPNCCLTFYCMVCVLDIGRRSGRGAATLNAQGAATSRKALPLQMLKLKNNTGKGRYVGHSPR